MNWRATTAAGIVFLALLGFVLVESRQRVAEEGEVFRHRVLGLNLYGIDTDRVIKLHVERRDEDPFVVEKRDGSWFITEPISAMANVTEVERMIREISELRPRTKREGVDLTSEDFGLEEPDLVATITYDGDRTAWIVLGGETPAGAERYASVSVDDNLYVVAATLRTTLWRDPTELREKSLVRIETDDVRRVTLRHGDEHVVAVRDPHDTDRPWSLTAPLATGADEWNVRQFINSIGDLRADGFVDEDGLAAAVRSFDEPVASVQLQLADGRSLEIDFADIPADETDEPDDPRSYARTSEREEILIVTADDVDSIQKTAFDLRDKSVVTFDRNDARNIRVERTDGFSFAISRRPDGWQVERPRSIPARQGAVDDILWNLEDLSAIEFVEEEADPRKLREYGLAVPQTAITIDLRGRSEPLKVLIGKQTAEGDYYATTSESDQIVRVSEFIMLDLPESVEDLEQVELEAPSWDD